MLDFFKKYSDLMVYLFVCFLGVGGFIFYAYSDYIDTEIRRDSFIKVCKSIDNGHYNINTKACILKTETGFLDYYKLKDVQNIYFTQNNF